MAAQKTAHRKGVNVYVYTKIVDMINDKILSGDFHEGEAITAVRKIAKEYGVNAQTVLSAIRTLVGDDLLEARHGVGLFVKKGAQARLKEQEMDRLTGEQIPAIVHDSRRLGLPVEDVIAMVKKGFKSRPTGKTG